MQTVLDNMNEGVQLFDKDFKIEFVNRKLYDYIDYPPEIGGPGASGFDALRFMAKRGDYGADVDVEKIIAERAARIRDPKGSRHVRRTGERQPGRVHLQPAARRPRAGGRSRCHRDQAPRGGAARGGRHPQADQRRPRSISQTVLKRLVESASKLCEADGANIFQRDGEMFRVTASHGYSPELTDFMMRQPVTPGRNSLSGRTVLERAHRAHSRRAGRSGIQLVGPARSSTNIARCSACR